MSGSVWLGAIIVLAVVAVLGVAQEKDGGLLAEIRAEIIPVEGIETAYGIPLSLGSLPEFVEGSFTIVPSVEKDARYIDSLTALVAPCCDDNTAYHCCCEKGGQACNIIRSGKGLAAYLIRDLNFEPEQVQASVLEWFRFARPDYHLAAELDARGFDPADHGLTTYGSCYRGMCDTPISQGGCGGMKELIEPAIESVGDSKNRD